MELEVAGERSYAYTGGRPFDPALPAVVFIHGAANDHSVWALQSRYLAFHGRAVLAVDLPGHGRSAGAPLTSVEALADRTVALLDTAGVATAVLVGHSLGALVALHAAAQYPARVRGIALLGPAVPMTVSDSLLELAAADDPRARELIVGWSYSAAAQLGGSPVPGMWLPGAARRLMQRMRPGVLATDLLACHRYADGLVAAAGVRCPALLILAGRDIMAPPRNAQVLAAALPRHRAVTLPRCGHALMAEEPDAVREALLALC